MRRWHSLPPSPPFNVWQEGQEVVSDLPLYCTATAPGVSNSTKSPWCSFRAESFPKTHFSRTQPEITTRRRFGRIDEKIQALSAGTGVELRFPQKQGRLAFSAIPNCVQNITFFASPYGHIAKSRQKPGRERASVSV